MTMPRAAFLVVLVTVCAYATSIGNGFALDDIGIIRENTAVTQPTLDQVLEAPYWPDAPKGSGLYRPVAIGSYAVQWWLFDGAPMGFHTVNVLAHAAVSLLLLALLGTLVPVGAALAGALLFAVHPVHVEAVANVVGQAELYAAGAVLAACWLHVVGDRWTGARRGARVLAIAVCYALGLGAKEIAVSLPALLVALDLARARPSERRTLVARGLPVHVSLAAVLGGYLVMRTAVLGTAAGELPAPALRALTGGERVLTALSVWPEYLRLFVFPLDLASDYAPAVILPATGWSVDVVLGILLTLGLVAGIWALRLRMPVVALGLGWFGLTILLVSNLVIPTGVILAERTLYLPSVGLSLVVAGLLSRWHERSDARAHRIVLAMGLLAFALLATRTALRSPTWFDTYTVLNTLSIEHPESYLSFESRAEGLARVGDTAGAAEAFETALALSPDHYGLAIQAAEFFGSHGRYARAEELLTDAIGRTPGLPEAYVLLSEYRIRQGRGQEGHRVAAAGLANAGPDVRLYGLLSESYITKGDLEGAVRARSAAVALAPESRRDWGRLAELYDALGRPEEARAARARAETITAP